MMINKKGKLTVTFSTMSTYEISDWVDYIANCALGETHCRVGTGASEDEINELMLNHGYDLCVRCGWWMENHDCDWIDGECVCEDCMTEDEKNGID